MREKVKEVEIEKLKEKNKEQEIKLTEVSSERIG